MRIRRVPRGFFATLLFPEMAALETPFPPPDSARDPATEVWSAAPFSGAPVYRA